MLTKCLIAAGLTLSFGVSVAAAQSCGGTYTVKRGDTLSQIADANYKDARKWSAIYGNNLKKIGDNPNAINIGQKLSLSCIGGLPTGLDGGTDVTEASGAVEAAPAKKAEVADAPVMKSDEPRKITLVTAGDFSPFTEPDMRGGGMFNEIVTSTMNASAAADNYKIYWVNDWASHLKTLVNDHIIDLGYPWYKPDCASTPDNFRCLNLVYADPMFETLILLFTDKKRPLIFNEDNDIVGKTLCRPSGYFTHDLDKNGRNWLRDGKITLKRPAAVAKCFEMLEDGEVDAIAINEFTGRGAIKTLGLEEKVDVVASRPLSIEGLHIVVHKDHPQADELIAMINSSFENIRDSGQYQEIIDAHMSKSWEDF
jgi:polar amino acid transport system substrate-binding protein